MKQLYLWSGIAVASIAAVGTGVGIKIEHERQARNRYEYMKKTEELVQNVKNEEECKTNHNGTWVTDSEKNGKCYKHKYN